MESKLNKNLIGSFVPTGKPEYLVESIKTAIECNENCFMFYTGSPQSVIRTPIKNMHVDEFKTICSSYDIDMKNIVVHAPYIINLSSSESTKLKFSKDFLQKEIDRVSEIGCNLLVIHPGNATNNISVENAIKNTANLINSLNLRDVSLCIETMSGKGTEICKNFIEVKTLLDLIKNKKQIGVCFDTCHVWDSGYNLSNLKNVLDEFDKIVGLNNIKCIHINDSENPCGSKKDRHANIGYGKIGFEILKDICHYEKFINLPKILETPIHISCVETYKKEVEMLRTGIFKNWIK
ncbi:MAG: deoxyribonuclease IV [Mycoplasmataceae bacterium]|nr:deoxyribonuclease IV [Mycoplasmataceae bacterium]